MRLLLWHPESESLLETTNDKLYLLNTGELEDVTDIKEYEEMFKQVRKE
jgi:hypothetical protein